jgi:hypothetical protein
MNNLIERFKGLLWSNPKVEVEGYILSEDKLKNMSLVLVKNKDNFWKSKWLNNTENTYKTPVEPLSSIFNLK